MDDPERRELHNGAGDALAAAFELIATPAVFGVIGWFALDRPLGTFPVFTMLLTLVVLSYELWKLYTRYAADMDAALEERRANYGRSAP